MNPEEMQSQDPQMMDQAPQDQGQMQDPTQGLTPDELAASLAFASHQQSQFIPQDEQEQPEQPAEEPQQEQQSLRDQYPQEQAGDNSEQLASIKDEITKLREEVKQALSEDDKDNEQEQD